VNFFYIISQNWKFMFIIKTLSNIYFDSFL
jgi:hypothetical protein